MFGPEVGHEARQHPPVDARRPHRVSRLQSHHGVSRRRVLDHRELERLLPCCLPSFALLRRGLFLLDWGRDRGPSPPHLPRRGLLGWPGGHASAFPQRVRSVDVAYFHPEVAGDLRRHVGRPLRTLLLVPSGVGPRPCDGSDGIRDPLGPLVRMWGVPSADLQVRPQDAAHFVQCHQAAPHLVARPFLHVGNVHEHDR